MKEKFPGVEINHELDTSFAADMKEVLQSDPVAVITALIEQAKVFVGERMSPDTTEKMILPEVHRRLCKLLYQLDDPELLAQSSHSSELVALVTAIHELDGVPDVYGTREYLAATPLYKQAGFTREQISHWLNLQPRDVAPDFEIVFHDLLDSLFENEHE